MMEKHVHHSSVIVDALGLPLFAYHSTLLEKCFQVPAIQVRERHENELSTQSLRSFQDWNNIAKDGMHRNEAKTIRRFQICIACVAYDYDSSRTSVLDRCQKLAR
jgi:hypothetical protein